MVNRKPDVKAMATPTIVCLIFFGKISPTISSSTYSDLKSVQPKIEQNEGGFSSFTLQVHFVGASHQLQKDNKAFKALNC